jgi:hypothetical protein
MDDRRFDSLTRLLASTPSRRRLLKGIAGALLGVGAVGVESASAQSPIAECTRFCRDNFKRLARRRCISQAAHRRGPCYKCGPAATRPHGPICAGTCCAADQVCGSTGCVPAPVACQQDSDCNAVFPGQSVDCLPPGCTNFDRNRPECSAPNPGICCNLDAATDLHRVGNCGGVCVDLNLDRQNCGACGRACREDQVCDQSEHLCCVPIGQPCQGLSDPCCSPVGQCIDGICRNP